MEVRDGVPNFDERLIRRINFDLARTWRASHYEGFKRGIESFIAQLVPGYVEARRNGRLVPLTEERRDELRQFVQNDQALREVLIATRERACLGLPLGAAPPLTEEALRHAIPRLIYYVVVYAKYVEKATTQQFAPDVNDFGDLECFIYLCDGRQVLTSERRWLRIAQELELGDLVAAPATL